MTSEQPPRDALRRYRPLPSINIPLLREERSAVRSRRLVVVAIAATVAVAALGGLGLAWRYAFRHDDHAADEAALAPEELPKVATPELAGASTGEDPTKLAAEPAAIAVPSPTEPTAPAEPAVLPRGVASHTQHVFGQAVSFRDGLTKNGVGPEEGNALIEALDAPMDFRRLQPDDRFTIDRDDKGQLLRFEYRSGLTLRYEAVRDAAGKFKARQIPVPIKIVRISKGGVVSGSLGDALEGLSLGRTLAGVFTEVFEGRINFSTDTRAGDTFRIILEQEFVDDTFLRYGAVQALEYKGEKAGLQRAFWHAAEGEDGDFFDEHGRAMHGGWLRTPLRYDHVSSGFGMRMHPVLKRKRLHNGIDYAAGSGTPVRAAADGTITWAGDKGPNGNLLTIDHVQGYETCYAHLLRFGTGIKKGVKVKKRQVVAYVGSTGRSTGPHLHFSLKKNGRFIDPASQLNGPGMPLPAGELSAYKRKVREMSNALTQVPLDQPAPVSTPSNSAPSEELGEEEL